MKIPLSRDRNNIFFIPDSYIYKNKVRIMAIYEDGKIVDTDDYSMMGPRTIKMHRLVKSDFRIFAKILEIKRGNKMF